MHTTEGRRIYSHVYHTWISCRYKRGRENRLLTRIHPVRIERWNVPTLLSLSSSWASIHRRRTWNCNHKHRSISILVYVCMYLSMVLAVGSDEADLSVILSSTVRLKLSSPAACLFHMCVCSCKKNPSSCLHVYFLCMRVSWRTGFLDPPLVLGVRGKRVPDL